jgi:NAD(P)-dependent dehydrogenase (short-subunit alcohol dehydrogenase family)
VSDGKEAVMEREFVGKVAIVTGAGSGIGRATAQAFAAAGARVAVNDRDDTGGPETVRMIQDAGGEAVFVKADVTAMDEVQAMVDTAVSTWGRLDIAFNNAGIEGEMSPTHLESAEAWNRVIAVNLTGVWQCMKAEIPAMLEHGGGAIVNCASVAGLVGFQGSAPYVASKHGVVGLTKTAALDYATQGIRVNAVCPGVIRTAMVDRVIAANPGMEGALMAMEPVGRLGESEEIADAVLWLASCRSNFVTGQAIAVDGGFTVG